MLLLRMLPAVCAIAYRSQPMASMLMLRRWRSPSVRMSIGAIVKGYGTHAFGKRFHNGSGVLQSEKFVKIGNPDNDLISTSYVERLNATTRLHMRRLTRLTLAFSKKHENFDAAVGLHFGFYDFVKRRATLKTTPAVATGIAQKPFSVGDLLEAIA